MRFIQAFALSVSVAHAFVPAAHQNAAFAPALRRRAVVSLGMSDFGTAMPEKPKQTIEEKIATSAEQFIESMENNLGEGVAPPPEIEALKRAKADGADVPTLTARIYELMIEQGMLYDVDPETGVLTPTEFDIKANLDVPEVKSEFGYLYKYGMNLIANGILDVETVKEIVKERLIDRTGLSPEEFDSWLGY